MKKILSVMLLAVAIFFGNNYANAGAEKIDSGLNFQQMNTGSFRNAVVVNCNEWISLREYPSTSAPRLAKIPLGTSVRVYEGYLSDASNEQSPQNGFVQTFYGGMVGWCLASYLRIY